MHAFDKLLFPVKYLDALLFVFVEEGKLLGDVLELGRKGYI